MAYTYWKPDAAAFYADPDLDSGVVLSGSTITVLKDLSGNSADFIQLNSEAVPARADVGGIRWADFDGAGQVLVGPTPAQLGFVLESTEDLRISIIASWDSDPSGTSDRIFTVYEGAGQTKSRVRHESTADQVQGTWDVSEYGGTVSAGTTYIYQLKKVGTSLEFLIDGSVVATDTPPQKAFQTGDGVSTPMSLGGFVDGAESISSLFDGKVGAVVVEVGSFLDDVKLTAWLNGWKNGTLIDGQLREGSPDPEEEGRPHTFPPLVHSPVIEPSAESA